ncbi:hypothetical protein [Parasphingorhabdus sp.]
MTELHPIGLIHFAVGAIALLVGAAARTFRKRYPLPTESGRSVRLE